MTAARDAAPLPLDYPFVVIAPKRDGTRAQFMRYATRDEAVHVAEILQTAGCPATVECVADAGAEGDA